MRAELNQAREDRQALAWFHARWKAVQRLTEGRPDSDLMLVGEILAATDPARTTGAPLPLSWDGLVLGPSGDTDSENTLVPCTTTSGAQAFLVLDDERRAHLGGLLAAPRTPARPAPPRLRPVRRGRRRVRPEPVGLDLRRGRRHRAGRALVVQPAVRELRDRRGPRRACGRRPARRHHPAQDTTVVEDDVARCQRCGCTEDRACDGGCYWVPNPQLIDLCSACATRRSSPTPRSGRRAVRGGPVIAALILGTFGAQVLYLLAVYLLDSRAHSGRRIGGAR
ncbi:hypothetical protein O1L44_30030 [Streptomyces noursei]|nr:hypothetical protein [Streptomyces noursei]